MERIKRELTLHQPAYPGKVVPARGCGRPGNETGLTINHQPRQLPVCVCNDIGGSIASIRIGMAQLQLDNNANARIADEALNDQSNDLCRRQ